MSLRAALLVHGQHKEWANVSAITPEGATLGCRATLEEHTEVVLRLPFGEDFLDLSASVAAVRPGVLRLRWQGLGERASAEELSLSRRVGSRTPRPQARARRSREGFRRRRAARAPRPSVLLVSADPALRDRALKAARARGCGLSFAEDIPAALAMLRATPDRLGLLVDLRVPHAEAALLRPRHAAPMPTLGIGIAEPEPQQLRPLPLYASGETLLSALLGPAPAKPGNLAAGG